MPNSKDQSSKSQTRKSPPKDQGSIINNAKQYLGPSHKTLIVVHASDYAKKSATSRKGGKRRKTQKKRRTQKK